MLAPTGMDGGAAVVDEIATGASALAMTEEGTIPSGSGKWRIDKHCARIEKATRRPRNDSVCDGVHSKDDTEHNQDA